MVAKNTDYGSFAEDIIIGLGSKPKTLSSKYFYNEKGDKLFQEIMNLPEYYLTRKEFEVLDTYKKEILISFIESEQPFNLVELGAGDGLKTKVLLNYLVENDVDFTYFPIDFSASVLKELKESLTTELPDLEVCPLTDTYRNVLIKRPWNNGKPTLILFLGSNLGNFDLDEALDILDHLKTGTVKGDQVLIGFDLKKNPKIILDAYNDAQGVTRAFNINLLNRINEEFNGNFDLDSFIHWPTYDPVSGECRSYLVSKKEQEIYLKDLDHEIHLAKDEAIFMEVSKKYSLEEIEQLASQTGFIVQNMFLDSEEYFADVLWKRI